MTLRPEDTPPATWRSRRGRPAVPERSLQKRGETAAAGAALLPTYPVLPLLEKALSQFPHVILHDAGSPINLLLLPHKSLPDLLMTLMAQLWQPAPSQGKCPLHTFPIKLLSLPLQLHPPCPLASRAQAVLGKDTCPRVHPTPTPTPWSGPRPRASSHLGKEVAHPSHFSHWAQGWLVLRLYFLVFDFVFIK